MTGEEIIASNSASMPFEVVATRDILPEEEVTIDYGPDWTRSWKEHVARFIQRQKILEAKYSDYVYSFEMNRNKGDMIRTVDEQQADPYPANLQTSCFYRPPRNTPNLDGTFEWDSVKNMVYNYYFVRPCLILNRYIFFDGKATYKVKMLNREGMSPELELPPGVNHIVTNVPHDAVRFTDKVYTTDQHLMEGFRHEIGLPEGVFQEVWLD